MRVDDAVLNVLRWRRADGRHAPDPFSVQRHPRSSAGRSRWSRSGSSDDRASPRRTCAACGSSAGARCRRSSSTAAASSTAGERFVYAYYPGVDTVAHEFGLHDEYFRGELRVRRRARRPAARRAAAIAPTLVVTADHGQVHVGGDGQVELHPRRAARRRLRGRGPLPLPLRARGARRPSSARRPARRVRRPGLGLLPGPAARRGLARPGPGDRRLRRRIGDVILAPRDPVAFVDPTSRTRPSCSRATARSPPTRCSSPSSPPAGTRWRRRLSTGPVHGACGRIDTRRSR